MMRAVAPSGKGDRFLRNQRFQRTIPGQSARWARLCHAFARGWSDMSAQIQLTDDDIAFLINVLRQATQPVSTQQLIDALRARGADR